MEGELLPPPVHFSIGQKPGSETASVRMQLENKDLEEIYMKRILPLIAIGMLGAWATSAQTMASGQAGANAQSQSGMQTNNSGAQASANAAAGTSSSASASTNAANNSINIANGTKIDATLATSLDAKRSKVGDEVEARTEEDIKQDGKVILKRGTHLVGHVTATQARVNGQAQSQLGIVFDRAVQKNGEQMPFNASIQALASAQSAANLAASDEMMPAGGQMTTAQATTRNGGGLVGGAASTAGATAGMATGTVMNTAGPVSATAGGTMNTVTHSSGAVGGLNAAGRLSPNSSGVFGLEGLSLNSAASSATQGSVIVSNTKNVHLDSGTQLLLQTTGQAQ